MIATIETSPDYFGRKWHLVLQTKTTTKKMFLGQDAKVCQRLLGMTTKEVVEAIGDNNLDDPKTLQKLAGLILDHLKTHHLITPKKILTMDPWDLAVE